MLSSLALGLLALSQNALAQSAAGQSTSSKRGLVYVPSPKFPGDDKIWVSSPSDLSWYYNYRSEPSQAFADYPKLQFVPMLWGTSSSPSTDTSFLDSVTKQIKNGANITYVLGFNEPDGTGGTGGSNMPADTAATIWKKQMEPLRELGVKLGAPAVTGSPNGFIWLKNFFNACTNCTVDFFPVHWYGNFEGLASHLGQVMGTYPNKTIWITEYALANAPLSDSQYFYKTSAEYFDRIENITHYSYFGSFRSDVSNVGPNAAMLNQKGALTDIGAAYLGRPATGNIPKGDAGRNSIFAGWVAVSVAVMLSMTL
ncbi:MAG: hypothetical protein M1814_004350 [Vezdaea aestivalis]|nr:MAG: hypothetical protein M1814_004350 [Vezdaea aestivalis]